MSDRAHTFKLGLFTLMGIALLLGFLALLGSGFFDRPAARAETYMMESVQGLDVGAPVKFRGVKVGKVTWIGFVAQKYDTEPGPDNLLASYVLVQFDIEVVKGDDTEDIQVTLQKLLKRGLHARVAPSSLMGPAYLELILLPEDAFPQALTFAWQPHGIYVPSSPSLLSQITGAIESLAQKLNRVDFSELSQNANTLMLNMNTAVADIKVVELRNKVEAFLDDAKASSAKVRELLSKPELDRIVNNVDGVAAALNSGDPAKKDLAAFVQDLPVISAKLRDTTARIDAIIADPRTTQMIDNLDSTMASAPAAAEEIRQFMARLNGLLADNREDVNRIIRALKGVLDSAGVVADDAKDNPSRLIFGSPPARVRPGGSEMKGGEK